MVHFISAWELDPPFPVHQNNSFTELLLLVLLLLVLVHCVSVNSYCYKKIFLFRSDTYHTQQMN